MKPFDSLIGTDTRAALSEAERIGKLVSRNVPAAAANHIVFCRLHDERLRIVVDSAAWVARLRFNERQMGRALLADGLRLKRISWHVAPPDQRAVPVRRSVRRPVDPRTAHHVRSVAEGMEDDALGRALARLAARLSGSTGPK